MSGRSKSAASFLSAVLNVLALSLTILVGSHRRAPNLRKHLMKHSTVRSVTNSNTPSSIEQGGMSTVFYMVEQFDSMGV